MRANVNDNEHLDAVFRREFRWFNWVCASCKWQQPSFGSQGRSTQHTHTLIIGPVHSILKWVDAFAAAIQPAPTFRYIIGNNNETQRKQSAARQPESARRFSNLSSQRGRRVYSFTIGWAPIPISFPDSTYGLNNTGTDTHTHTHTQSIDQYNLCPREKQKRKKKKKIKVFFFSTFQRESNIRNWTWGYGTV
jgi:hypothetical protein